MCAAGTYLGSVGAFVDIAAVSALPAKGSISLEGLVVLEAFQKFVVALLVGRLYLGNQLKLHSQLFKAFFPGFTAAKSAATSRKT